VCFTLCLAAPGLAAAEPVVLSVDGDRVIVDLGAGDGVGAGTVLELLHEVTVSDPVTRETLRDVFPIGELTVVRAGDGVCEARPDATVKARVRAGDAVRLVSAERRFSDPWQARVAASTPVERVVRAPARSGPGRDAGRAADDAAILAVWRETLGRPLLERVALWEKLLAADPDNVHARYVDDEIANLRAQQAAIDAAADTPPADRAAGLAAALGDVDGRARSEAPIVAAAVTRARQGAPIALAFAVREPDAAALGWLYARTAGDAGYQRFELAADGDAYLRGEIPAALVEAPGVEWFVEVAAARGEPRAAIGRADEPRAIAVVDVRDPEAAPRGRSRITATFDYVDFDGGLDDGYDQYTQAEIDFMYRFYRPVYAFRLGFGTLTGMGGPKDVIDDDPGNLCRDEQNEFRCRKVNFTYGYAEAEVRIRPNVAVMLRPQIGRLTIARTDLVDPADCLEDDLDPGCSVGKGYGFRARVRLGEEAATNLVVGLAATSNVGTVFEAAYTWTATPQLPVVLAVQVTDLPVTENLGVRIVGDVGWRQASWLYPSLRLSYQARDVDHAGFSGGLGFNFNW